VWSRGRGGNAEDGVPAASRRGAGRRRLPDGLVERPGLRDSAADLILDGGGRRACGSATDGAFMERTCRDDFERARLGAVGSASDGDPGCLHLREGGNFTEPLTT